MVLLYNTPAFRPKIVYSYVIEIADSESDLGLHSRNLVSEIFLFLRLRVTITIHKYCSCMYFAIAFLMHLHKLKLMQLHYKRQL